MKVRGLLSLAAVIMVALGTNACSSDSSDKAAATASAPATEATCTTINTWSGVPANVKAAPIAKTLNVPMTKVSEGTFGQARCDKPLSLRKMELGTPPVISVKGHGSHCAAIGTLKPPTGSTTKEIMAICAGS